MENTQRLIFAGSSALLALMSATAAQATGVTAGTLIENTASATFTSGSSSGSVQSNTVTLKVDELLDVAVAGLSSGQVAAGSTDTVLAYSVTNTGNGPEAFKITANPTVTGNSFDVAIKSVVVDSNGNGTYDPGVDQVLAAGSATPLIAADSALKIFVVVTLPAGAIDTNTSQVRLTADAATGTGPAGTVFATKGDGGGDAVVGASTASSNALDSLIASTAAVALNKSATIADPFGGTQPVPGAIVTFSIVARVTGTGSVTALHVTDAIPGGHHLPTQFAQARQHRAERCVRWRCRVCWKLRHRCDAWYGRWRNHQDRQVRRQDQLRNTS